MSNHIHFIAYAFAKHVFQVMKSLKTYTANQANKIIGRTGRFWQREYFDRIVRDRNDLDRKINYTLNNPEKINLVENWKQWSYSYCSTKFLQD
jgi:putative transposase